MSNVILVPNYLINAKHVASLIQTYGRLFYISPTSNAMGLNGLIHITPQVALKNIASKKNDGNVYFFSPEQFPTTLTACHVFLHQNIKYVVSSFFQMVVGFYQCPVYIAKKAGSSNTLTCYRAQKVGTADVLSTYIDELSSAPVSTASQPLNLYYETVIKQELHRLLTLQYYLRQSSAQDAKTKQHMLRQVQKRKKTLVTLVEECHA